MLIASDIQPLPCGGKFSCTTCRKPPFSAREAVTCMRRGCQVEPADLSTADLVARKLYAAGNETRADMIWNWAEKRFGGPVDPPAELSSAAGEMRRPPLPPLPEPVPAEPHPAPLETGEGAPEEPRPTVPDVSVGPLDPAPENAPATAQPTLRERVEACSDDFVQLRFLAERAGCSPEELRMRSPEKLRSAIYAAAARNVAEGKPELSL